VPDPHRLDYRAEPGRFVRRRALLIVGVIAAMIAILVVHWLRGQVPMVDSFPNRASTNPRALIRTPVPASIQATTNPN
jgi:hypothetical protein